MNNERELEERLIDTVGRLLTKHAEAGAGHELNQLAEALYELRQAVIQVQRGRKIWRPRVASECRATVHAHLTLAGELLGVFVPPE